MNPPTATVALHLLGPFTLTCSGIRQDLAYEKGRALLAFLVLQPKRTHSRAYLANLLWPGLERAAALANLRVADETLARFLDDLHRDPAHAFEWSISAFEAAASALGLVVVNTTLELNPVGAVLVS